MDIFWSHTIDARGIYLLLGAFILITVASSTKVHSQKMSVAFTNSKLSSPSIDTSWPSTDPYCSSKTQYTVNVDIRTLIHGHCAAIISLAFVADIITLGKDFTIK